MVIHHRKLRSPKVEPCRWHNGSTFVFYPGDCLFESEPSPTSAHACSEVTDCVPAVKRSACVAPEVDLRECTLHSPLQKSMNKAQPVMALKPRGDVTRKKTCVCQKLLKHFKKITKK